MDPAKAILGLAMLISGGKALKDSMTPPTPVADAGDDLLRDPRSQAGLTVRGKRKTPFGPAAYAVQKTDVPLMAIHGINTLDDRMKYIKQMVDVGVRGKEAPFLWKIVHAELSVRCGDEWCNAERDWDAEIRAIYDFVRANVRYGHDIREIDTYQSPMRTLESHHGDCDDLAVLIAAMAKIAGYPVKARVIRTEGAEDWNHIYALVGTPPMKPKKWVPMDASVKGKHAGWEAPAQMIADKRDFPL